MPESYPEYIALYKWHKQFFRVPSPALQITGNNSVAGLPAQTTVFMLDGLEH